MSDPLNIPAQQDFAVPRAVVGFRDTNLSMGGHVGLVPPRLLHLDRSGSPNRITLFTEGAIGDVFIDQSPVKIAWLLEPQEYDPHGAYTAIADYELAKRFDLVLTHNEDFLRTSSKFVYMPLAGCWIDERDWGVASKTKNLSIIASSKAFLEGHQLRHTVIQQFQGSIDGVYGNGYQQLPNKITGLRDFRYSLIIENVRRNYFFTEKLIDAFVTGTVPVYWGCPDIAKFFNPDGMIQFADIAELPGILAALSPQDYERRLPAIRDNFLRAQRYAVPEDHLYQYVLQPRFDI